MSETKSRLTKKQIWTTIKHSPVLSVITAFVVTNLITILFTGGIHLIGVLANLFPTVFAYFLSVMYNENRKSVIRDKNKLEA